METKTIEQGIRAYAFCVGTNLAAMQKPINGPNLIHTIDDIEPRTTARSTLILAFARLSNGATCTHACNTPSRRPRETNVFGVKFLDNLCLFAFSGVVPFVVLTESDNGTHHHRRTTAPPMSRKCLFYAFMCVCVCVFASLDSRLQITQEK